MHFHLRPAAEKASNIERTMAAAAHDFPPSVMVNRYLELYRELLEIRRQTTIHHG